MGPVVEGMCLYESILDGKLSLEDFAEMNDTLAVRLDNRIIMERLEAQAHGSK